MPDPVQIIVPVKGLTDGKSRLADVLAPDERAALNRYLAERTLRTVRECFPDDMLTVVSPDPEMRTPANEGGAHFVLQSGTGLNAGLAEAASALPPGRTIIVAADLPDLSAADLALLADIRGIGIAPDESGNGTNALSLPTPRAIAFQFGPNSFTAHKTAADATGLPVDIFHRPGLAFDLDTKDNLS
ncbi:MAG: 2-phospho-L-lactate guanylyltransferase, partial [Alphaproteobacteria bacterium]